MEDRPTSDRITAYSRGLRRVFVFQLVVGAIALFTVAASAFYISQKRNELAEIQSEKDNALAATVSAVADRDAALLMAEEARADTERRMSFNLDVVDIGITASRAGIDEIALKTAVFKIDRVLFNLPDAPEWDTTRFDLFRLRITLLDADGQGDQAVFQQAELVDLYMAQSQQAHSDEESEVEGAADAILDLAALLCKIGDTPTASRILGACYDTFPWEARRDRANFRDFCGMGVIAPTETAASPSAMTCSREIEQISNQYSARLRRDLLPVVALELAVPEPRPFSTSLPEAPVTVDTSPGAETVPQENEVRTNKVFLHIREDGQRAAAVRVAKALCESAGLTVPKIERVAAPRGYPEEARLVYYHPEQADAARALSDRFASIAAEASAEALSAPLQIRLYEGRNLPRDRVEIWFDPRSAGSEDGEAADLEFSCEPN